MPTSPNQDPHRIPAKKLSEVVGETASEILRQNYLKGYKPKKDLTSLSKEQMKGLIRESENKLGNANL